MGKKSRVQAARKQEQEKLELKLAEQKKEKQKTRRTILLSVCAFVLVLALVFGVIAVVTGSGVMLRGTVSLETEHIKVDNAMLSYFFYNNFYNYVNNNSTAAQQTGLNTNVSLKQQNYSSSLTWFDYIMGRTESDLITYLNLAEAAKAEGMELDEDDIQGINDLFASIDERAAELGVSRQKYIAGSYGRGVKEDDVRRALELLYLAEKKNEGIVDSINFTTAELESYFSEHEKDFTYVSYKHFDLSAEDYFGDEAPDDAADQITLMAAAFGAVKSEEEFDAKVKEYTEASYKNTGKELTDDQLKTVISSTSVTDDKNYSDSFSTWAFDETRKVGDTVVLDNSDGKTAYYLTETAHRRDYTTKNIRQILITSGNHENAEGAKAEAERILAEWKAGEATDASFEALADKYNEGLSAYYENMTKNSGLSQFDEWIYDDSRKAGDADVVETYYGYHVIYLVGDGDVEWEAEVKSVMTNDKYDEITHELEEKYPVTCHTKKYNGVSGKVPSL